MEIIWKILLESAHVFREAAIYLLLGFLVAGMLRIYIRPYTVAHYFRKGRIGSVLRSSLLGIPIPL